MNTIRIKDDVITKHNDGTITLKNITGNVQSIPEPTGLYATFNEMFKMRELLMNVYESTGPGAADDQLMHAHLDVAEYIMNLPK